MILLIEHKEKEIMHCDFMCNLCGTNIKLPACCGSSSDVKIKEGKLVCNLCGSNKKVPLCCGKEVLIVADK